jgi:hypothetical protein
MKHGEVEAGVLAQYIVGDSPEIIGEIASEYGGHMHFTPEVAVGFMDNGGYGESKEARRRESVGRICLDEHGKFPQIYLDAL